ncbi:MRG domain-containing protein [Ditylenchus destructor]|uniref:MRG domain-containing protein n=1 Tax=Ditylenchus destructor TaxID=166010 RepID=A0AAD4N6N9_9BILA|nr:MRG domain-containing protein [Ditylenchus destructor]
MATECEKENELADSNNKSNALPDDLETATVTCPIQPTWKVGDVVLCKYGEYSIPYEARIIDILQYIDQPAYVLRFKGFGEKHNEEFCHADALEYFLEPTVENRRKAKEIQNMAIKAEKAKKRRSRVSNANQKKETEEFGSQKTPRSKVRTSIQQMTHESLTDPKYSKPVSVKEPSGKKRGWQLGRKRKSVNEELAHKTEENMDSSDTPVHTDTQQMTVTGASDTNDITNDDSAKRTSGKKKGWPRGKKRKNANEEPAHKTEENMDFPDTPTHTGIQQMALADSGDTNDISSDVKFIQPDSTKRISSRKKGWPRGRKRKNASEEPVDKREENLDIADAPANHNSQLAIIDEPGSSNQKVRKRRRSNIDHESQPVAVDKNDELIAVPSPPIPFFAPEEEIQSASPEPIVLPAKLKTVLAADKRQAEEHLLPSIPARFTVEEIMETFCKRHSQEEKYRVFGKELLALFNSRFEKDAMSTFESPLHQDIRSNVGNYFYGLEKFMPEHLKNDPNKQKRGPSEMSDMFGLPHLLRFLTKFHEIVRRRMDKSTNLLLCIDDFVQFLDKFQDLYFDESKDYYPAAMGYLKRVFFQTTYNWQ